MWRLERWEAETDGEEATRSVGRALAGALAGGEVLALHGPLGAGKTVLAQGVLEGLGVPGPHPSPTFTLVRTYAGRLPVHHVDLYRLADRAAGEDLGWSELLEGGEGDAVALVEWAEALGDVLPADRLDVFLERPAQGPPERRRIRLVAGGPRAARLLGAVAAGGGVARPRP